MRQGIGPFAMSDDVEPGACGPSGVGLVQRPFIDRVEGQARLPERGLQGRRDGLDPDQHGHVRVGISHFSPPAYRAYRDLRFRFQRRASVDPDRIPVRADLNLHGTDWLFETVHVVGNDARGPVYDLRPAPVVLAQGVDHRARIPPLKRADVLGVRTGEGIDHLVVVAHGKQVVQRQGEQPEHQELDGGEILDLVHQDRIEAVLVHGTRPGVGEQDFHGAE